MRALLHLRPSEKQCSQSKCKTILPPGSKYKTCEKCQNSSKLRTQRKWKRQRERRRMGVHVGRSIFRKQLRMAGQEIEISHILTLIVIMRSPPKKMRWVWIPLIHKDQTFIPKSNVPKMDAHIKMIRDFADGLEYQVLFQDRCFLKIFQKEGAGFFWPAENCLSHECRFNSSQEASPTMWESLTANTMFCWACAWTAET